MKGIQINSTLKSFRVYAQTHNFALFALAVSKTCPNLAKLQCVNIVVNNQHALFLAYQI